MEPLLLHGSKASYDVAQALSSGELSESHADELVETGEGTDTAVALVTLHTGEETTPGKEVQKLREDDAACMHMMALSVEMGQHVLKPG